MTNSGDTRSDGVMSPDDTFAVLGNETRMGILQELGDTDGPLSFSDLRSRVGVDDPGRFNYHLNRLTGHFIRQTDEGYLLREPGSIIVQAVLSGVVTRYPIIEPTAVDIPCPYCGSDVELSRRGWVIVHCTECMGTYSGSDSDVLALDRHPYGTIATYPLPPAGLDERTTEGILRASMHRMHHELLAMAEGICPLCSGVVERELRVCEDHGDGEDVCSRCKRRHALHVDHYCTSCIRVDENIPLGLHLIRDPQIMAFIGAHDINPVFPDWEDLSVHYDYGEEVRTYEPFEGILTYHAEDDALVVTVDGDLDVVDVERRGGSTLS